MSFERSTSLRDYVEKRLRRIYPAYGVVILVAALGSLAVSTVTVTDYFSGTWWRYLGANLVFANFLQPTLPGVFEGHAVPEVNGALWTLKIEVMFYATVPLIVVAVRRWGAWPKRWPAVACVGVACLVADRAVGVPALEPVWLAAGVAVAGFWLFLGRFGRYGDLSYGLYVLHFPVVQVLVGFGLFRASPAGGVAVATAIVIPLAFAMWHLVERPWLRRSSHYVASASGAGRVYSPTGRGDASYRA